MFATDSSALGLHILPIIIIIIVIVYLCSVSVSYINAGLKVLYIQVQETSNAPLCSNIYTCTYMHAHNTVCNMHTHRVLEYRSTLKKTTNNQPCKQM